MGTRYTTESVSGYNATPPADDGTVSESNKVKWSTTKTKLSDPLNTAIANIDSKLTTHFNVGPTALTTSTTLDSTHFNKIIQVSGSGVTLTLTDAATLAGGWYCWICNTDSTNAVTLGRATGANTINGTAGNYSISPGQTLMVFVIAAANGFLTVSDVSARGSNTFSGDNTFSGALTRAAKNVSTQFTHNLGFTASVASNNLTVALKGADVADPSATNPVAVAFRSTTVTSGGYVLRTVTAAMSVVLAGGQTLGFAASEDGYMYIYLCDDGSTRQIGLCKEAIFDETALISTAVISSATSATTLYTTSVMTGAAIRLIGRISIAPTGANWANAASSLTVWTPSMRKTGDILYRKRTPYTSVLTGATTIPADDTVPQSGEGNEYMTTSYTPLNARNILRIRARLHLANTAGSRMTAALFKDAVASALATGVSFQSTTGVATQVDLEHSMVSGTVSAISFAVRAGSDAAGTTSFNGEGGVGRYGGTINSFIEVIEIQA